MVLNELHFVLVRLGRPSKSTLFSPSDVRYLRLPEGRVCGVLGLRHSDIFGVEILRLG